MTEKRGASHSRYFRRASSDQEPRGPMFKWVSPGRDRPAKLVEVKTNSRTQRREIVG